MPAAEYSAWVLILQLSAYVSFLDLGVQTAIGKFVAEFDARGEREESRKLLGSAFLLLSAAALCGLALVAMLAWRVPQLFHQMPASLWQQVRLGLIAVGCSLALSLPLTIFGTVFTGLQQYTFPTALAITSRIASTLALVVVILRHGTLAMAALALGIANMLTAAGNVWGWKRYARRRVPFTFPLVDKAMLLRLAEYCGVLGIWTTGTLLISGLDTTIVGHYDYGNTGYYAVAASAVNFMLVLLSSVFAPLMPAASSLTAQRTASEMGAIMLRVTRYCVLLLLTLALPLLVGGYTALRLWVGPLYAAHAVLYLRILLVANVIRYLAYTYSLMVVAAGKHRYATASPVVEAIVNLTCSLILARRYGAVGVALGTLIGAGFGIGCHVLISMRATQGVIRFRRLDLLTRSIGRPLLMAVPALLLFAQWWHQSDLLPMRSGWLILWLGSTAVIGWLVLNREERGQFRSYVTHRLPGVR